MTVEVLLNIVPLTTVWGLNQAAKLHVRSTFILEGLATCSQVGQLANESPRTLYKTQFYKNRVQLFFFSKELNAIKIEFHLKKKKYKTQFY